MEEKYLDGDSNTVEVEFNQVNSICKKFNLGFPKFIKSNTEDGKGVKFTVRHCNSKQRK